jgi:hypothetical protein
VSISDHCSKPAATTATTTNMSTRFDETSEGLEKYLDWTANDVADFLKKAKLGAYSEVVLKHKISGRLLHLLTDNDLKDMGISIVGDRLRVKALIDTLGRKHRITNRTKVWWEGEERLYFSDGQKCCSTCAGICPDGRLSLELAFTRICPVLTLVLCAKLNSDPSTYKLTSNHLKIKTVNPYRIGPVRLPCCHEYSVNNVDLTQIDDIDVTGQPAPCCYHTCCCAPGKGHVDVSTKSGRIRLTLTAEEAEKASGLIMQNIEECQRIERD